MYSAQVGVHSASIGLAIEETETQKTAEIGSLLHTMRKMPPHLRVFVPGPNTLFPKILLPALEALSLLKDQKVGRRGALGPLTSNLTRGPR